MLNPNQPTLSDPGAAVGTGAPPKEGGAHMPDGATAAHAGDKTVAAGQETQRHFNGGAAIPDPATNFQGQADRQKVAGDYKEADVRDSQANDSTNRMLAFLVTFAFFALIV